MDSEKVGNFIYQLRTNKGLTQNDLAEKIHVTNKAISRWERGLGFPDISLLESLSKELDVSILELLKGEFVDRNHYAEKEDISVLLNTLVNINNKYKFNKLFFYSILIFLILVAMLIIYFNVRFYGIDNSYLLQIRNNISFIPFTNLYSAIKNFEFIFLLKNIGINLFLSTLISIYILQLTKKRKLYIKILIVLNLFLELVKWLLLIGIFDINDFIIRMVIGILILKVYKIFMKGGD